MVSVGEMSAVQVCHNGDGCFSCSVQVLSRLIVEYLFLLSTVFMLIWRVRYFFQNKLLCQVASGEHNGLLCNAIHC